MTKTTTQQEQQCANCGATYTPHHAYRNKTQACDGPNGYCAGVIDGRDEMAERISELERERDEARGEAKGMLSRLQQLGQATGIVLPWTRRQGNPVPRFRAPDFAEALAQSEDSEPTQALVDLFKNYSEPHSTDQNGSYVAHIDAALALLDAFRHGDDLEKHIEKLCNVCVPEMMPPRPKRSQP